MSPSEPPPSVAALFQAHYPPGEEVSAILVTHSRAVAELAVQLAARHGLDETFVEEAAWLHDIGIRYTHAPGIACHGDRPYLWHGVLGREICERAGLPRHGLVCERHVGTGLTRPEVERLDLGLPSRDMLPLSPEEKVICYADKFFSKSSDQRLPLEIVRGKLAKHGEPSLQRFEALHAMFG